MNEQTSPRKRRTVPVVSRDSAERTPRFRRPRVPLNTTQIGVLGIVSIFVLLMIAAPTKNYIEGRSQLKRLNESIVAKQEEKDRLLAEIEKYSDEDFIREEARRRLGLIEPGETAFRIIHPDMESGRSLTTSGDELTEGMTWYEILWASIATPPVDDPGGVLMEE